jgi:hypothetical protein
MQSDMQKGDLYASHRPKKTQTWKSGAGEAHGRVLAEYLAEVPEEPKQVSAGGRSRSSIADLLLDPQCLDLHDRCHHVYGCRCL